MRVLICGGRDFKDKRMFVEGLDLFRREYGEISTVIEGGASGADRLARGWAQHYGLSNITFPAQWQRWGKKAGAIRNSQMLREGKPDAVIAFPGGKGTADMVKKGTAAGILTVQIENGPADTGPSLVNCEAQVNLL